MNPSPILVAVAVLAAAALTVWLCVPPAACLAGLMTYRVRMRGDASELSLKSNEPDLAGLFAQLEQAGFRPLGLFEQSLILDGIRWRSPVLCELFATRDCQANAFTLREGEPRRLALRTVFDNGLVIDTAAQEPQAVFSAPLYDRIGIETNQAAVLLEKHRERIQPALNAGRRILPPDDVSRIESDCKNEFDCARPIFVGIAKSQLTNIAGVLAVEVAVMLAVAGTTLWAGALGVIFAMLTVWSTLRASRAETTRETVEARRHIRW